MELGKIISSHAYGKALPGKGAFQMLLTAVQRPPPTSSKWTRELKVYSFFFRRAILPMGMDILTMVKHYSQLAL